MTHMPYASTVGSLMCNSVYKARLVTSCLSSSRYMHDPGRGHWKAVKWILRYIKGIIDIGLIFKKDVTGKQKCIRYVDSNYAGDLDKHRSTMGCVYIVPSTGQLALYSIVYCRVVYCGGRVYGPDGCYERCNLASKFVLRLADWLDLLKINCDSMSAIYLEKN